MDRNSPWKDIYLLWGLVTTTPSWENYVGFSGGLDGCRITLISWTCSRRFREIRRNIRYIVDKTVLPYSVVTSEWLAIYKCRIPYKHPIIPLVSNENLDLIKCGISFIELSSIH
jgi:hypothetical protein